MKKIYLIILLNLIGHYISAQCTVILNFDSINGSKPTGRLYYDGTYLYGTTANGGNTMGNCNPSGCGTIFKIKPDGSGYQNLWQFTGTPVDGGIPNGTLIFDGTFLYGTTSNGGTDGYGTIFKIMPNGTGYTKLIDFSGLANGANPLGSLIYDGTFLYGTTSRGGMYQCGTIFKLLTDGSGFIKIVDLGYNLPTCNPHGDLYYDGTFLYAMTYQGGFSLNCNGNYGCGTIFKIKPDGTSYIELMEFTNTANGSYPSGSFISDGTFLYGMTSTGGANGEGTIFKIMPNGTGYTKLLDFKNDTIHGFSPKGSLYYDGFFLYGTTEFGGINNVGTIFKIKTDGSAYAKVMDFSESTYGGFPMSSLISDGSCLYGTACMGGSSSACFQSNGCGTVFKIGGVLSIAETKMKTEISIYPNPTNSAFSIKTNTTDKLTLDMYDVNGRYVFSKVFVGTANIDASNLDNGIYTLTIKNGSGITYKKLVIAR